MAAIRHFSLLTLLLALGPFRTFAQEQAPSRILILPLHSNGVDSVSTETAESILRTEISKISTMDIISEARTREALHGEPCADQDCAIAIGKRLGASRVLSCQLSALGEKIITQYFLLDVGTERRLLVDQMTAANTGDLEMVMKRLARSAITLEPIEKTAEVGMVMEAEGKEQLRRSANKNVGFSFGYLYPQEGYDNSDRTFVTDARFDYELEDYAAGMMVGIRRGFAINLYGSALLSRTDICPYLGGAFGFHWVSHTGESNQKKGDGFELTAHTGLRLLHTYNFQLIFALQYTATLNDFHDRAIVFTLGIL